MSTTKIYWPSESSVAYKILSYLSEKPIGHEVDTLEVRQKLDIDQAGLNSFLKQALNSGYAECRKDNTTGHMKLKWSVTNKFRNELSRRIEVTQDNMRHSFRTRTHYVHVNKHKTPYELECLIRGVHEVRDNPKEFNAALIQLYQAAGIPTHIQHIESAK